MLPKNKLLMNTYLFTMNARKIVYDWTFCSVLCGNKGKNYCYCYTRTLKTSCSHSNKEGTLRLSPENEKKKQLIEMEMRIEKERGNYFIPDKISDKNWINLMKMKSQTSRKNYYKYLKNTEISKKKAKEKHLSKVLQRREEAEQKQNENLTHIKYGLGKNSLFFKIRKSSLLKPYYNNLRDAVLFGQKVVIDLGYEKMMNIQEMQNCVDQINICHGVNKRDKEPFYLHLCNAKIDGQMVNKLKRSLPFLQKPYPLVNLTEESYLDLFPKNKLVYLTSECDTVLETYSHDDIYIIEGFIDEFDHSRMSLAKARQEDIRMARLPLEKYLNWGSGSKCLTIDQVFKILLTMKDTMDWSVAFQHVPTRKLNHHIRISSFWKPSNQKD